ncbi:MAG: DUF2849 domain-containing protein [Myxococcales bacterium]|nr:DUF2849 domain-containing protein [Myxococcales bacterium]
MSADPAPAAPNPASARTPAPSAILTASRVADGRAVYLRLDRVWSEALRDAGPLPDEASQQGALEWARGLEGEICDPYLMKVRAQSDGLEPISARERIRALGPGWIRQRFGYQV